EDHLRLPAVRAERPAMAEGHDRAVLRTPVLVVKLDAVGGGDVVALDGGARGGLGGTFRGLGHGGGDGEQGGGEGAGDGVHGSGLSCWVVCARRAGPTLQLESIRFDAQNTENLIRSAELVDRLAVLLERFPVSAQVFNAGALCGINL